MAAPASLLESFDEFEESERSMEVATAEVRICLVNVVLLLWLWKSSLENM